MQKWNIEETAEYQEGMEQLKKADRKIVIAEKALQRAQSYKQKVQENVNQGLARARSERIESLKGRREQVQEQMDEKEAEIKACFNKIEASQGSEFTRIFYKDNPAYHPISARQYRVAKMHGYSIGSSAPRFLKMTAKERNQRMLEYCQKEVTCSESPVQELTKEYLKLQEELQSLEAELEEIKDGLLEVCETFGHDVEAEKFYEKRTYCLTCKCCGRGVDVWDYDKVIKSRKITGVIKAIHLDSYTLTGIVRLDDD